MKIPKQLESGGVTYKIVYTDLEEKLGEVDFIKQEIKFDSKLTGEILGQVFWHEVMHTINNEIAHTDIEFLGQSIYKVLKDNGLLK